MLTTSCIYIWRCGTTIRQWFLHSDAISLTFQKLSHWITVSCPGQLSLAIPLWARWPLSHWITGSCSGQLDLAIPCEVDDLSATESQAAAQANSAWPSLCEVDDLSRVQPLNKSHLPRPTQPGHPSVSTDSGPLLPRRQHVLQCRSL